MYSVETGSVADTETWKPTKFGPSGQSGPGGSADKHGVISSANQKGVWSMTDI